MMTKKETRPGAAIKLLIAVPLIAAIIFLFSCGVMKETSTSTSPETSLAQVADQIDEITIFVVGDTSSTTLRVPREKSEYVKDSVRSAHAVEKKRAVEILPADPNAIYIVNGEEVGASQIRNLDPNSILSINVLKSESAKAAYGSKAANGVILITLKPQFNISSDLERAVFMIVEDMPKFDGGDVQKFSNWVRERVKYPEIAHKNGIQGKVYIGFVVEPDGSVSNVTLLQGVDKSLDDEALRVVRSSPPWKPGVQRGQEVPVRFSITINFDLGKTPYVKADSLIRTGTVKKY